MKKAAIIIAVVVVVGAICAALVLRGWPGVLVGSGNLETEEYTFTNFTRVEISSAFHLSPESFSAVQYAAHLAEGQAAKLTIIHVVHSISLAYTDFVPPVDMVNFEEAIEDAARDKLDAWVRRHIKRASKVSIVLRKGVVDEAICDYAKECDASVIVIATHGRKGLGHVVLGNVAERVARNAPCPVPVVRAQQ